LKSLTRSSFIQSETVTSEQLEALQYPVVMVPFNGNMVPVKLRELSSIQIQACGNFSLIETFNDKVLGKSKKLSQKDIIEFSEIHHKIAQEALVKPTYDEIMKIYENDEKIKQARESIKEIKEKLHILPRGPARSELEEELTSYEIWTNMILPNDFLAFIVSYSLGVDKSDIKKITEDILLDAAILAERGKDNPADHVKGRFTDYMLDDINKRAWTILAEYKDNKQKKKGREVPNAS